MPAQQVMNLPIAACVSNGRGEVYRTDILDTSFGTFMTKNPDDKKRDEVLKRLLQTPHKPHVAKKKAAKKKKGAVKRPSSD